MAELMLRPPVTPFTITQRFGENLTCVNESTGTCVSRRQGESCPPGYVPLYESRDLRGHNGIDLTATHAQPVYAALPGKVRGVSTETERGIGVTIISSHRYAFVGGNYRAKTRYWHLLALAVRKGQRVTAGELIGWADNTGLSAGTHLHFELKPMKRGLTGRLKNAFPRNSYYGAVDPEPYFVGKG